MLCATRGACLSTKKLKDWTLYFHNGITTFFGIDSRKPEIPANSRNKRITPPAWEWESMSIIAVSSANAFTLLFGNDFTNLRRRTSATTAKSNGDKGHPCRIPLWGIGKSCWKTLPFKIDRVHVVEIEALDGVNEWSRQTKGVQCLP